MNRLKIVCIFKTLFPTTSRLLLSNEIISVYYESQKICICGFILMLKQIVHIITTALLNRYRRVYDAVDSLVEIKKPTSFLVQ
jgi:hypothetical protein